MWAWVFENGQGSQQASPAQVAQWCAAQGYKWAALEYDDPAFQPQVWWPQFHDQCLAHNVLPLVWMTVGGNIYQTPSNAHGVIAEIEGPGDYEGLINVINGVGAGPLPTCPKAIVTNFNIPLISRSAAQPLLDAGFSCLPECYLNENPNVTPDNMDRMARSLGFPGSQPVFGRYPVGGNPAPSYAQWEDWPGVDYLGENLI